MPWRALAALVVLNAVHCGSVRADELPPDVLQRIKAATVFVQLKARGYGASSGTGFVIRQEGEETLIVTHLKVIRMPSYYGTAPIPAGIKGETRQHVLKVREYIAGHESRVYVTIGSGTGKEQALQAEIIAEDPAHGLAVLRVRGVAAKIQPIDFEHPPEVLETMSVFALGFPFGVSLSKDDKNPAVTITKASVSSIRENDQGQKVLIQIDGQLDHGNSGGPIVDSKGGLIAIALLSIEDSGISFGVPAEQVSRTLEGNVVSVKVSAKRVGEDRAAVHVWMKLSDPLKKLKSPGMNYAVGVLASPPDPHKPAELLPNSKKLELKRDGLVATGDFEVPIVAGSSLEVLIQPTIVDGAGKTILFGVHPYEDDFSSIDRKAYAYVSVDGMIKGRIVWTPAAWIENSENRSNPKKVTRSVDVRFTEVSRNDEFVALRSNNGNTLIRLYADRIEYKMKTGRWETSHHGGWQKATEADIKLASAPPPDQNPPKPAPPAPRTTPAAPAATPKPSASAANAVPAAIDPARAVWKYTAGNRTGSFTQTQKGWEEEADEKRGPLSQHQKTTWRETERTSDYIELADGKLTSMRLYADHSDSKVSAGSWRRQYSGKWEPAAKGAPAVAATTPAPAAPAAPSGKTPPSDAPAAKAAAAGTAPAATPPAAVASATPAPAESAPAPIDPARAVWVSRDNAQTLTFTHTENGWVEAVLDQRGRLSIKNTYRQTASTSGYIEVSDGKQASMRLYADRAESRTGSGSWQRLHAGKWEAASQDGIEVAATTPAARSPAKAGNNPRPAGAQTGKTAADRVYFTLKPGGNRDGVFRQTRDGWLEENNRKIGDKIIHRDRNTFREVSRNDEYVELLDDRKNGVRLYADHADVSFGPGWRRHSEGRWEDAPVFEVPANPTVWRFKSDGRDGTFTKNAGGWLEETDVKIGDRVVRQERNQFREATRNEEYVELIDDRRIGVRLYPDHADHTRSSDWKYLYDGHWEAGAKGEDNAVAAGPKGERTVWKYENQKSASGTFRKTADGWVEEKEKKFGNSTRKETIKYRETATTDDYIEMLDERRNIKNRIYADHTEWGFGNGGWTREWTGSWVSEK